MFSWLVYMTAESRLGVLGKPKLLQVDWELCVQHPPSCWRVPAELCTIGNPQALVAGGRRRSPRSGGDHSSLGNETLTKCLKTPKKYSKHNNWIVIIKTVFMLLCLPVWGQGHSHCPQAPDKPEDVRRGHLGGIG